MSAVPLKAVNAAQEPASAKGPSAGIAQAQQPILIGSTRSLLRRGDARPFFHLHSGDEPVATVLGTED
jgi:hypothetical protein